MTSTNHGNSCGCGSCRARRASEATTTSPPPGARTSGAFSLPPLELDPGEKEAIADDPVAFIAAMQAQDFSSQQIRSKLLTSGMAPAEAKQLMEAGEVLYKSKRGDRGVTRVATGVAALGIGVIVTIALLFVGGLLWLFGPVLIAGGVFQLIKGSLEIKAGNLIVEDEKRLTEEADEGVHTNT